ncbi:MAG: sigma-54 dependent transcriptional regulator [Spirochaetes bacterium]|nr:sigma-54 dependent transcriptional regulator [Spirochaetota bacterium]
MTAFSPLRKEPGTQALPTLFAIQRNLSLHGDVVSAFSSCVKKLAENSAALEVFIAFAEGSDQGMRLAAVWPEGADAGIEGGQVRMGRTPCGLALEKEDFVSQGNEGGLLDLEAPIWSEKSIAGIVALVLPAAAPMEAVDLASELLRWTAFLIEEALGLRSAIAQRLRNTEREASWDLSGKGSTYLSAGAETKTVEGETPGGEEMSYCGILGSSTAMKEVFTLIEQVAGTEATVLVTGESGTGKELVAKAIHEKSTASKGPFVAVNCSALPETIIESELFGHEKGSFTGATTSRLGRFEAAKDGSLFLDEIGDLSPTVQVKLLRILQERSFERVGGNRVIRTNARIIAATHRDLTTEVEKGSFREDLFFRLNVFPIHLPPLRERGADILLLADYFIEKLGTSTGQRIKRISSPALDLLMVYHWPGNVRELENCIARAIILSTDGVIHSYNLPPSLQSATSTGTEPLSSFDGAIARLEKELLVEALKIERGNSALAARRLGVTERRFRFALQKYKLDFRSYRTKL